MYCIPSFFPTITHLFYLFYVITFKKFLIPDPSGDIRKQYITFGTAYIKNYEKTTFSCAIFYPNSSIKCSARPNGS